MAQYNLNGKVAVVTGAGSGIGEACAKSLARSGAKIAVSDVAVEKGERVVGEISQDGEALFVRADVSKPDEVEALIEQALETFGRLDIIVNNAGMMGRLRRLASTASRAGAG